MKLEEKFFRLERIIHYLIALLYGLQSARGVFTIFTTMSNESLSSFSETV